MSLDSNENQFIVSFGVEDHMSAHVNPVLTIGEYGHPSCLIACGVWKREKREKPHARARTHILNALYRGCIPDSLACLELFFLLWRFEKCNWESYEVLGFSCVFVTRHQNFAKVTVKEHKKYLTSIHERPNLLFGIIVLKFILLPYGDLRSFWSRTVAQSNCCFVELFWSRHTHTCFYHTLSF